MGWTRSIGWWRIVRTRPPANTTTRLQAQPGFLEARRVATDQWRVFAEEVPDQTYPTTRYRFVTPKGELSMVLQSNEYTAWVSERLVKKKTDIELIGDYVTAPKCDVEAVNREAAAFGDRGIVRGHICCFDVFGQPGCWQDAACLVGIQELIHGHLRRPASGSTNCWESFSGGSLTFARSLEGAAYDLLELGGGDASSTVISPAIFDEFVAPYDAPIIAAAHAAGQRIVYHTCGGMMPLLERHRRHEARRDGDVHAPGNGRRYRPGRGQATDRRPGMHDRRLRPVPFLQRLHARGDPRRSSPLL